MTRVDAYYVTEVGCDWSYVRPGRCPNGGDPICCDNRRSQPEECRHYGGVEKARVGKGPVTVLCSAPTKGKTK